jgi:hypothetical protein
MAKTLCQITLGSLWRGKRPFAGKVIFTSGRDFKFEGKDYRAADNVAETSFSVDTSGNITVVDVLLPKTNLCVPPVLLTAQFKPNGNHPAFIFQNWDINSSLGDVATWDQLDAFNSRPIKINYGPTNALDRAAVLDLLRSVAYAPATANSLGLGRASVPPLDPLIPIFVSDNDSRIPVYPTGVYADGITDDTAALQAAINNLQSGQDLILPGPVKYTSALVFRGKRNISFGSRIPVPYGDAGQDVPSLIYAGPAGGTLFKLSSVRDSVFRGFGLYGQNLADIGLQIVQNEGDTGISSYNTFEHMIFSAGGPRATWQGVVIGDASSQNCEFMRFDHCSFIGDPGYVAGAGVGKHVNIVHANVKGIVFEDCQWQYAAIGILNNQGSFSVVRAKGGAMDEFVRLNNWTDTITLDNCDFEATRKLINSVSVTGTGPILVRSSRFDDIPASGVIFIDFHNDTAVQLTVEDNHFFGHNAMAIAGLIAGGGAQSQIDFKSNTAPGMTVESILAQLNTFGSGEMLHAGRRARFKSASNSPGPAYELASTTSTVGYSRTAFQLPGDVQDVGSYRLVPGNDPDALLFGDGEIQVHGPGRPKVPTFSASGDQSGAVNHSYAVLAKDAAGNKTMVSYATDNSYHKVPISPSSPITLSCVAVPGAAAYDFLEYGGGQYRLLGSSATPTLTATAPPAGALGSYDPPSLGQATVLYLQGVPVPKIYRAVINQSGTSAPVATVLINSLGGTPVFTRSGSGAYRMTLANAFTDNRTFIAPNSFTADTGDPISIILASTSVIQFNSGSDDSINSLMFEISVYPA